MKSFKEYFIFKEYKDNYKYASLMSVLHEDLKNKIKVWSEKNIANKHLYYDADGSKGREDNSHITVVYGFKNKDLTAIKSVVKKFGEFDISLDKIGKFSSKEGYDVIKINVISKKLLELHEKASKVPHFSTYSEFSPHCTIAYVKPNSCDNLIGNDYFKDIKINVKELSFHSTEKEETIINIV